MAKKNSWKAPVEPTRTAKANATPRMGQKKSSPYKRMQMQDARKKKSFERGYSFGRTRMVP